MHKIFTIRNKVEINEYIDMKNIISWLKTLRVRLLTVIVTTLVVSVGSIIVYSHINNTKSIKALSTNMTENISKGIIRETQNYLYPVARMVSVVSKMIENEMYSLEKQDDIEKLLIRMIKAFPQQTMLYVGGIDEKFAIAYAGKDGIAKTKYIYKKDNELFSIIRKRDQLDKIFSEESSITNYNCQARPWFRGAVAKGAQVWSDMYVFHSTQTLGITVSEPIKDKDGQVIAVVGADLEFSMISDFLKKLSIGNSGMAYLVNGKSEVIGYKDPTKIMIVENGKYRPVKVDEIAVPVIRNSYEQYIKNQKDRFVMTINNTRYLSFFIPFPDSFGKNWKIGVVVPEDDFFGNLKEVNKVTITVSFVILLMAIFFANFISKNISKPVMILAKETKRIRQFHLDFPLHIKSSIMEIQYLIESMEKMRIGLKSFSKYLPYELVRQLVDTGKEVEIGGEKKHVTIMFSDITDFTSISERESLELFLPQLQRYFDDLSNVISSNKGTIDKYIGDAIMSFWGTPIPDENQEYNACMATLMCRRCVDRMNAGWDKENRPKLHTRFGIHSGEAIVGNVGSSTRMNYTLLGDTVNIADRLEILNKDYGTKIIVTENCYKKVCDAFYFRPIDIVVVKGRQQAIKIYELLDEINPDNSGDNISDVIKLSEKFTTAFELYHYDNSENAFTVFKEIEKEFPADELTKIYIERCKNKS